MFRTSDRYINSAVLQWLWKRGWEEPIGPLGPLGREFGPSAEPWRGLDSLSVPWQVAVPQLIQAVQARDLAARLDGPQREHAHRSATAAIASVLEDWCGTPPRKWPWPWPGPPPWTWEVASELSLAANALQEGSLKEGLLDVARQVVQTANRG